MPNRILRDWTDSESINSLDNFGEVFFTRLLMKADDFGRFHANPKLLRSLLFPLKDGIRESDISRGLAACQEAGLIALYVCEKKPLLEIVKFRQRTRAAVSRFPARDDPKSVTCQSNDGQMTVKGPSDAIRHGTT